MMCWVISIQPNEKKMKKQQNLSDIYIYIYITDTLIWSNLQKRFIVDHNYIRILMKVGQCLRIQSS